jgi:hypothetical protein
VADSRSGGRPPLRASGFVLLGLAVAAAIAGLFTAATGGGGSATSGSAASTQAARPTPAPVPSGASAAPAAPDTGALAPGTSAQFVPGEGGDGTAGTGAPAVEPSAPAGGGTAVAAPRAGVSGVSGVSGGTGVSGGSGSAATERAGARLPLRVYNNSLVKGLAAKASADFRSAGWTVTEIGGYEGSIPRSTVYYRPGTAEESAANALARSFGLHAEPRFAGIQQASPGVIVIVTKEYRSPAGS